MLSEFLEAIEDAGLILRIHMEKFAREEFETEKLQEAQNAGFAGAIKVAQASGVNNVQSDANGDSFTMAKTIFRDLLEFVRGPVAKIQRASGAELEGIARTGNMIEV